MIKKITIKNFKAITDLTIEFTPLTVLIGENSSGKSTVLQALGFLCSITTRDIDEYLKDRDWEFSDIKSQFASVTDSIRFIVDINISGMQLTWDISMNNINDIWQISESIHNTVTNEYYLSYGRDLPDHPIDFSHLNVKSSALKMLHIESDNPLMLHSNPLSFIVLNNLKSFLASSSSFELLSPDRMRSKGSRGKPDDIGSGGEKLAAYIHGMNSTKKTELNKLVSEFIGYNVSISTTTKGVPGWVEMILVETWGEKIVKVKKRYISDGLLRIIALAAIIINSDNRKTGQLIPLAEGTAQKGFILLDELEDGISTTHVELLLERIKAIASEMKRQIVITSHSPVMLNYIDASDILFMWRDSEGTIRAKPMFQTAAMRKTLEVLGPGEVWMNYSKDRILLKLLHPQEGTHDQNTPVQ